MGAFQSQPQPSCSCDLSLVIFSSKQLEALLEAKFEATGKGLHEKINSAAGLSEPLKRKLRRVATIRNKLVHEPGFDAIPDRDKFVSSSPHRFHQCVGIVLTCSTLLCDRRQKIRDFNEAKEELTAIAKARGIDTKDTVCNIQ